MYEAEETLLVATLLDLLPEYPAIDGCSIASAVRHALIVREPLFVDAFSTLVDRVLLVDVEQSNQGIRDVEDCVPRDD